MRTYTRTRIPGATYFFTVNLARRHGNDLLTRHIHALREAFRVTQRAHPFVMEAAVVLPDHLHCLWRLPPGDDAFPMRWRLNWEHVIRDERDWRHHLDYIHFNPVRHGLVGRAIDWPARGDLSDIAGDE